MRAVTRVAREALGSHPWIPVLYLLHVLALAYVAWACMVSDSEAHKHSVAVNAWLLTVLTAATAAWVVLVHRRRAAAGTGAGLLLAGFGLLCRLYVDLLVLGLPAFHLDVLGGRAPVETYPRANMQLHIAVHRHGGLAAFVLGIALTALAVFLERRRYRG